MTLHDLTRRFGTDTIAEVLGISERSLRDRRAGTSALTVGDLLALRECYPQFDLEGTVKEVGELYRAKRRKEGNGG